MDEGRGTGMGEPPPDIHELSTATAFNARMREMDLPYWLVRDADAGLWLIVHRYVDDVTDWAYRMPLTLSEPTAVIAAVAFVSGMQHGQDVQKAWFQRLANEGGDALAALA